jgi:hypothetical protein
LCHKKLQENLKNENSLRRRTGLFYRNGKEKHGPASIGAFASDFSSEFLCGEVEYEMKPESGPAFISSRGSERFEDFIPDVFVDAFSVIRIFEIQCIVFAVYIEIYGAGLVFIKAMYEGVHDQVCDDLGKSARVTFYYQIVRAIDLNLMFHPFKPGPQTQKHIVNVFFHIEGPHHFTRLIHGYILKASDKLVRLAKV